MFPRREWVGRLVFSLALLVGLAGPWVESAHAQAIPALTSAVSRKAHGAVNFDIPLPLAGGSGIECRLVAGAPTLVLLFDQPITAGTAAVTGGTGSVAAGGVTIAGNAMTVVLTGATNAQAVTVTASNVLSAAGGTLTSAAVTVRLLHGDLDADGTVTNADVSLVTAAVGVAVSGFNYRFDRDFNGSITGADVTAVSGALNTTVAGGASANTLPTISNITDQTGVTGVAGSPIAFTVGDAESGAAAVGVRVLSSNTTLVPTSATALGGNGAPRTLIITPVSGQTGTVTITVEVGDGIAVASDTFVLTVTPPPKLFTAYLRPQGGAITPGSGFATLLLSGDETKAELKATYANLTTPEVSKHIHGPAGPGVSAGILFDIDTAEYNESSQSWRWDIGPVAPYSAAEIVTAIKSGNTYINIHSSRYPNGEIRGQFLLSTGSITFTAPAAPPALPGGLPTAQDAARFLHQSTFGPTKAEITRLQQIGYDAWLTEQFAMPTNRLVTQLANNGFETPTVAAGAISANPTGATWVFTGTSGITANGSVLTTPVSPAIQINAPMGSRAAYIKATGRIAQTFNVGQAGKYIFSFLAAPRTNLGGIPTLSLKLDGVEIGNYVLSRTLASSDAGRYNGFVTLPVALTAGSHVLAFDGVTTGAEDTAFIDDVRIALASSHYGYVRARLAIDNGSINGASRNIETWWRNSITGDDQLRQRVAFALAQIFVVSAQDGTVNGRTEALANYHDMLVDNAFGNFRALLREVTLHPIMGQYLNMRGNTKPLSPLFTAPNENYAREVLQLFSVGLNTLWPDGTLKLGTDGLPIPTYDQSVIEGFANVFTGWNLDTTTGTVVPYLNDVTITNPDGTSSVVRRMQSRNDTWSAPMSVNAANVSTSSKKLLNGVTIAANANQTGGVNGTANAELNAAMDNIFNHPNVGPFICRQLIQRLVTSNPSPAYVYRVAQVFDNDGTAVRGNLRAVIKAILTDYEARSTDMIANQGFGHLREPVLRVTGAIRPFSPTSVTPGRFAITTTDTQLGQTPFRSPTVFNFFEPYYVHPGQLADSGLNAPEFQISTEIMAVNVPNFLRTGIYNASATTIPVFQGGDIRLNLAYEQAIAGNATALVNHLNLLLMCNSMPAAMKTRVISAVNALPAATANDRLVRARFAVYLITSASQCAVQK
ncbi:DUF1800 family protein [Humisphaera borealis]|uniref:DUF1800 family protein n=1 Tax=Humisphaera borealis TaxID=2807512 RepID=A0A7M2X1H3_9BACT|nr:DUF1800 family protein [Humisphaera borealis]QOV90981.1 DUF1800 family protein [Humisphaera borealis]